MDEVTNGAGNGATPAPASISLSSLRRDKGAVNDGMWVRDLPGVGALQLHVRGMQSKAFTAKMAALTRNVLRHDREPDGRPKFEVNEKLVAIALHDVCLIDWHGLVDDDGQEIPYTRQFAYTLMTDPEYRPFQDAVVQAANYVDNMTKGEVEALRKNSETPSSIVSETNGSASPT